MSQPQDGGAAAAHLAAHDMAAQPSQQRAGGAAAGWLAALQCDPGSREAFWGLRIACEGRLREPGARSVAAEGDCVVMNHQITRSTVVTEVTTALVPQATVPDIHYTNGQ